jgi:signal peptidase II
VDLRLPETPSSPGQLGEATTQAPAASRPSWTDRVLAYRTLWVLALIILALDQLTKIWIAAKLEYPTHGPLDGAIIVIDGFFYLTHVGNTGAAWSMFRGQSAVLAVFAGLTLLGIYFWRHHLGLRDRRVQISFGLLCGGIVGNFLDRILHGHVIDFLDFHFGDYVYPTFNVADIGICVGVLLYLWHSFREPAAA